MTPEIESKMLEVAKLRNAAAKAEEARRLALSAADEASAAFGLATRELSQMIDEYQVKLAERLELGQGQVKGTVRIDGRWLRGANIY